MKKFVRIAFALACSSVPAATALGAGDSKDLDVRAEGMSNDESHGILVDDRLAMIGARVPEVGGLFMDADAHVLYVHVTKRRADIVGAISQGFREAFPNEQLPGKI